MFTKQVEKQETKIDLVLLKEKFHYEIKYLKEYLYFTSKSVEERTKALSNKIYEDTLKKPEHEALLQEMFIDENKSINSFLYHSTIVLIYTLLESSLSQVCSDVRGNVKSPFSFDMLHGGNIIQKTIDYLKLTADFPFASIEKIWPRIGQFQKLRNAIVHQNGKFQGKDEEGRLKNKLVMLNMFNSLELSEDESQFYIMDETIVLEFIDKIEKLMDIVYKNIESKSYVAFNRK
jgi:hypothetical protein